MNYENVVFVIQDVETDEIVLVTRSREKALDFLPFHQVTAIELEVFTKQKPGCVS